MTRERVERVLDVGGRDVADDGNDVAAASDLGDVDAAVEMTSFDRSIEPAAV
jgi:hypothetical protein